MNPLAASVAESAAVLSAALFVAGAVGVLTRRNLLVVLLSLQLMLGAAALAFVAFARLDASRLAAEGSPGPVFALIAIVVGAAQLTLALGLVVSLVRRRASLDVEDLDLLKW